MDDKHGGELAAKKFIDKGCKNPLIVTLPDELACVRDRKLGFECYWEQQGLSPVRVCRKNKGF